MRRLFVVLAFLYPVFLGAQDIYSFKLGNGLTVIAVEDSTQHEVFGEVVVRTGSVNDPEQYTGLAHYLEHVMFKGTQKIGALDWEKEKPIYEQIIAKYDELAETAGEAERAAVSRQINELTLAEGEISISQEYSNLIESIGGNSLNAGTSFDYTVYYNTFPANQIVKWLSVASERFINPVFRAFQSELETVYEEYNMNMDDPGNLMSKFLLEKAFEGTPYARQIIGLGDHLKNPRLSRLIEFYNTWYVPENMALILAGNFSVKSIRRAVISTFGRLQPGTSPQRVEYPGFNVKGRVSYTSKFSDYPTVCIVFNGVRQGDPDEYALDICTQLLSNSASTGFLDRLSLAGDVMGASASPVTFVGQGRVLLEAVPYYDNANNIYDSSKKVEGLLMKAVKSLLDNDFTDETLNAVKVSLCRDYDLMFETNEGRTNTIAELFLSGQDVGEVTLYKEKVLAVTREDILRVARKYLNDNYIVINNEVGTPDRKQKIKKPDNEPLKPLTGQSSAYAQWFKGIQAPAPQLSFVDWNDVRQHQLNSYSKLYYSQNPSSDIYTLQLKYGANSKLFPKLKQAAQLMNSAGVMAQYTFQQMKELFGQLGATYSFRADDEYLYITLRGYESTLKDACLLLTKLFLIPSLNERQLDNLKGSMASGRMIRTKNVNLMGDALNEFILYGDQSDYINEITDKEILDLSISGLTGDITNASHYAAEIHYSGGMPFEEVLPILSANLPLVSGENPSSSPLLKPMCEYGEDNVFFVPNTEAQQAQIYFYIPLGDYDKESEVLRMAFNQYFSGGFNGLVMQEIREKNSLAYTAYGKVSSRGLPGSKAYFTGYVGTQNDKALTAVELYSKLIKDMPLNEESIGNIKNYLKETILSMQPDRRSVTARIASWQKQGYTEDPSAEWVRKIDALTFEDIVGYYESNIKGKPLVIGIVGNPKNINAKDFSKFGKFTKLNEKRLFNEKDVLFQ